MLVPSSHQLRGGIQPRPGHPLTLLLVHMAIQELPSAWVRSRHHSQDKRRAGRGGEMENRLVGEGLGIYSWRRTSGRPLQSSPTQVRC